MQPTTRAVVKPLRYLFRLATSSTGAASRAATLLALSSLAQLTSGVVEACAATELVVAQDGSAKYRTVQEAIMAVPSGTRENPVRIRIKPGTYRELIYVQREKRFFRLVGEDAKTTILTFDLHANITGKDGKPIGTFRTPSTTIDADDFLAENITFENSAGPIGQAVALRVDGDRAVFRKCRFLGWQDTVLLNRGRHYFEDCYIAGDVDFIFGAAVAYFERCHIHALRGGYITAASTPHDQPYGFVFSDCRITAESAQVRTYLGRPWRDHASVVYLNTEMSAAVRPEGWHNWNLPAREKTARFAEYNSSGPGADARGRVAWARQLTQAEARTLTPQRVLGGTDGFPLFREVGPSARRSPSCAGLLRARALQGGRAPAVYLHLGGRDPRGEDHRVELGASLYW